MPGLVGGKAPYYLMVIQVYLVPIIKNHNRNKKKKSNFENFKI